MEKLGVVRPDVTPESDEKKAADCVKSDTVDNEKLKITQLDEDFRKQAADRISVKLRQ